MTTLTSPKVGIVADSKPHFRLHKKFVKQYKSKKPPFGFNGLGELVFYRTYSRLKENGKKETWTETCERVVNTIYTIQKKHIKNNHLGWNESKAQRSAQEMFDRLWNMKFLGSGRGLWALSNEYFEKRPNGGLVLINCSAISTSGLHKDPIKPFTFMMDALMQGCGVGFDTFGAGKIKIVGPDKTKKQLFVVPDSREGWVQSLRLFLESYFFATPIVEFDFSEIRPAGMPLKTFGGIAPGPDPLILLYKTLTPILDKQIGSHITETTIADLMNLIGKCVVSGGIRRSSQLILGNPNSHEFLDLKDYTINPEREAWGWSSNNSISAELGMDYAEAAKRIVKTAEPGFIWLQNGKAYSRMVDYPDNKDMSVGLTNPSQPIYATVLLKTPDGPKISTIGDIEVGNFIWTETGWGKVIRKIFSGIKPVYKYSTTAGEVYCTKEHRIISNGKKIGAGIATSIDRLAGPIPQKTILNKQDIIDGLMIGDGSFHAASKNLPYLCVGDNDQDYFESEIGDFIKNHRPGLGECAYEVKSSITATELPKTYSRKIPDRFFYGSENKKCGFLRGLFSANGDVIANRVQLRQTSLEMIIQVQQMLSSLGIVSYYTTDKEKDIKWHNGTFTSKESYKLAITGDRDIFASHIGFIQRYKNEALNKAVHNIKKISSKTNFDIKETEYVETTDVFDITVDNGYHTYWSGGLNVANCGEIFLEAGGPDTPGGETCNLCCVVPNNHDSLEDFQRTLKFAYLYAKTVTLVPTNHEETNQIVWKNRRIGCSMTGVQQFVANYGIHKLKEWCTEGYKTLKYYDRKYSDWFGIPRSIKITTIQPHGTMSNLVGATSGMHWPESRHYIRRVRLSKNDTEMINALKDAGYSIEPAFGNEDATVVIEFPISLNGDKLKTVDQVSMWEQLSMAAFLQKYWSDNSVSCTITFDPKTEGHQIENALNYFQYQLKSISFLPRLEKGAYRQMPFEAISEERYNEMVAQLKPIDFSKMSEAEDAVPEKYCDGDKCTI